MAPPDKPVDQGPFHRDVDDAESESDGAIDDADDIVDDEFADLQRTLSAKRREEKDKGRENRIQDILPFPFAPNIRPLGISDLQSVIALENAAFPDPQHRASPEKVGPQLLLPLPTHDQSTLERCLHGSTVIVADKSHI